MSDMKAQKRKASRGDEALAPSKKLCVRTRKISSTSTHLMTTRGISTENARKAILDTTELLAAIILHLPMASILRSRAVCKRWETVIEESPSIQTKLFLRPSLNGKALASPKGSWLYRPSTKELRPHVNEKNEDELETMDDNGSDEVPLMMRPAKLNPLLFKLAPDLQRPGLHHRANLCERISLVARPSLEKTPLSSIHQRMFITQPPCRHVVFHAHYDKIKPSLTIFRPREQFRKIEIVRKEGVTFGDIIYEFLAKMKALKKDAGGFGPPVTGYRIKLRTGGSYPKEKSLLYMLGSIFVSHEEEKMIEAKVERSKPSPLAQEMMDHEKAGLQPERFYRFWSEDDQKWAKAQEDKIRGSEGTKAF